MNDGQGKKDERKSAKKRDQNNNRANVKKARQGRDHVSPRPGIVLIAKLVVAEGSSRSRCGSSAAFSPPPALLPCPPRTRTLNLNLTLTLTLTLTSTLDTRPSLFCLLPSLLFPHGRDLPQVRGDQKLQQVYTRRAIRRAHPAQEGSVSWRVGEAIGKENAGSAWPQA